MPDRQDTHGIGNKPLSHRYDDIINLPHHVSKTHAQLSRAQRAAQFSPFAALSGYGEAVLEACRYVDDRRVLSFDAIDELNEQLCMLAARKSEHPVATFTVFVPDRRKKGGSFKRVMGHVVCIDKTRRIVRLLDGTSIAIDDIFEIA